MSDTAEQPSTARTWRGVIAVEDRPSVDGRFVERGALTWGDLPLALANAEGIVVGWVDTITRDGDLLRATGRLGDVENVAPEVLAEVTVDMHLAAFVAPLEIRQGTTAGIARLTAGRILYVNALTDGTESAWPETIVDGIRS